MCHARIDAAPVTPVTPKAKHSTAAPPPRLPGARPAKTFGQGLLEAAAEVATAAVSAVARGGYGRGLYYDELHEFHTHRRDAEQREAAFGAAAIAQAQAGLLTPAGEVGASPDEGHWQCPRTHSALVPMTVEGLHAHANPRTGGLMLEAASERHLVGHPELWAAWVEASAQLASAAEQSIDGRALVYMSCPSCGGPMVRKNFEKVSGIMVDSCPAHGTWFDAGELAAALQFLEAGGRRRRAEFEAREAAHIAEEKRRTRRIEARTVRYGGYVGPSDGSGFGFDDL